MQKIKICTKCRTEKEISKFGAHKTGKGGLNPVCNECSAAASDAYRRKNKAKVLAALALWRNANREKVKAYAATYNPKYYIENRPRVLATNAEWRKENKEKMQAYGAAYYAENIDRAKATMAAWRAANKKKLKETKANYYAANVKKIAERGALYRKANPEKIKARNQNRRARKLSAEGTHTAADVKDLFTLQRGACACCRASLKGGYHVDHILSLFSGGSNGKRNLQLLCATCNLQKHVAHPVEFMQRKGYLL
jgi:5-methylcytosine-specific restriction endonuclease McrA